MTIDTAHAANGSSAVHMLKTIDAGLQVGHMEQMGPAARLFRKLGQIKESVDLFIGQSTLKPHMIGDKDSKYALSGTLSLECVYEGGPLLPVVHLDAAALKAGHQYEVNSSIRIYGDIPKAVIIGAKGRVTVFGDVGPEALVWSTLPEMKIPPSEPQESSGSRVGWRLTYADDKRPAITVTGHVDAEARIYTNAGIRVGSTDASADFSSIYECPVVIERPEGSRAKAAPQVALSLG